MALTNQPTLKDYARRMRSLVETDLETAADLRELAKEMRETGFQAAVLKAWVKAMVLFEQGDAGPVDRLMARTSDVALYGEIFGFAVDGFGGTKRNVINESPRGDGDGGVEGHAGASRWSETGITRKYEVAGIEPGPSPSIPKAAPEPGNAPDTSDGDPARKDGYLGAASIQPAVSEAAAISPGADSDNVALPDGPVGLPAPTLDGEGAGEIDPFEIPGFLRRVA